MFADGDIALRLQTMALVANLRAPTHAVVATCLASTSPMLVCCEREQFLVYNDAAIPFMGSEHPSVLGCPISSLEGERWRTIRNELLGMETERTPRRVEGLLWTPVFDTDELAAVIGTPLPAESRVTAPDDGDDAIHGDEMREANRAKDDFLAIVGHELRTPLSTVATMLHALLLRNPTRELELMERALGQLSRLVDDLLESSRLSRGQIALAFSVVELAHVVDRAIEHVGPLLQRHRVSVTVPRSGLRMHADADRLGRAITNVLTNAAQHTPPERPIRIEAQRKGDRIQLRIVDEGRGISGDRLDGVFQAFQGERREGGLGLGLSMARSIVELHHGSIAVTSGGTGCGTECTIELPATEEATDVTPTTRHRLLLVEDNDDAACALKLALEQLGYEVAVAHDAPIALNLAKTFRPHVALLDLGLPVMDGWELAKRLRDATHTLPIVAVTAKDQDSDKQKSSELGFAEHLVKPIDLPRLKKLVDELSASRAWEA